MIEDPCGAEFREVFLERGGDVAVSTAVPIVAGLYEVAAFTCRHGVVFYVEPTGDQHARWAREAIEEDL